MYIKNQYPKVLFNTDLSGVRLPYNLAKKVSKLRSNRGFPDIGIYESKRGFSGLFLEVKKESPFRKDGELKTDKHIKEQSIMHDMLRIRNYQVHFVWDFDQAKVLIDYYLNEDKRPKIKRTLLD